MNTYTYTDACKFPYDFSREIHANKNEKILAKEKLCRYLE